MSSSNPAHVRTYNIQIYAVIGEYKDAILNFDVQVIDKCAVAVIAGNDMADLTYYLFNTQVDTILTAFTENVGYCGSFVYTASLILPTV